MEYYSRAPDKAGHDAFLASGLIGDALMKAILHASVIDPSGADYLKAIANGYNPEDPEAKFFKPKKYNTPTPIIDDFGSFAIGSNYIPFDMNARVHSGEEITPRPFVDLQKLARDQTNALLAKLLLSNDKNTDTVIQLKTLMSDNTRATERMADTLNNRSQPIRVEVT
jgi:hypothetical protein